MPPEVNALLARFNHELDLIEQDATEGLKLTRTISERFSHQALIQTFAFFNNALFFVNTQKIRLQMIIDEISFLDEAMDKKIQVLTQTLDNEIDRILEVKKVIEEIIQNLNRLK